MTDRWNGKTGEYVRWAIGLVLTAALAYVTAIGAINVAIAGVTEREQAHFDELLRRLDLMQQDIRELRSRP